MSFDSFINDMITEVNELNVTDELLQALTYPIKFEPNNSLLPSELEVDVSETHLSRLLNKVIVVCQNSEDQKLRELMRYCSLNSKSDLWLECMLYNLKSSNVATVLDELLFFVFEAKKLENVVSICINSHAKSDKPSNVERTARMICNIPTYVANSFPHRRDLKFFDRMCFVDVVLSAVKNSHQFNQYELIICANLVTHLSLTGHSVEVMSYILNLSTDSSQSWPKVFVHIQEKYLECCLLPLFSNTHNSCKCIILLSQLCMECNGSKLDFLMRLFRRLLFVRLLMSDNPARMIFSALFRVISCLGNDRCDNWVDKTNDLLGLPSLRLWSESISILNSSIERHVYICQVMLSWLTDFRIPLISSHANCSLDSLLPDILTGITNHLASPREEIRVLGMAIGEWVTEHIELFSKSEQKHSLKFKYTELDLLAKIRPYFTPLVEINAETSVPIQQKSVPGEETWASDNAPKSQATINTGPKEIILDSDDDPDPEDCQEPFLQKLPRRTTVDFDDKCNPSQLKKPRYLRECLDGMLMSKTEENSINLACTLAATELIYSHPEAAKELAVEFARVLVHVQPPISSNQMEVDDARHKALIAIGVTAPKECARYLTREFCQSGYSVGQRLSILSALKSIACELAGGDLSKVPVSVPDKSCGSSDMNPKTRRFFKKVEKSVDYINRFAPLAGEFFFPLLHSIPQLTKVSVTGPFAHQDSCLLANLLASLATIYACARFSSCQNRMACELIELIPVLHRHPEPAVRRALFIAAGSVITVTPLDVLASHPQILFSRSPIVSSVGDPDSAFLLNWLKASSESETDSECQILASSGLLALVERLEQMKIS